jgi:hypothetical protein
MTLGCREMEWGVSTFVMHVQVRAIVQQETHEPHTFWVSPLLTVTLCVMGLIPCYLRH